MTEEYPLLAFANPCVQCGDGQFADQFLNERDNIRPVGVHGIINAPGVVDDQR